MIKPIQRICKYPLLLRELIKQTDSSHPDYEKLKESFEKVEDIVTTINEKKRESEMSQKMYELSQNLSGAESLKLITPTRRFISEGELNHLTKGKIVPGYYFLFNDLFLYTKKKGKKYQLKVNATLRKTTIRYASTFEKPTFEIQTPDFPNNEWLALCTDTQEQHLQLAEELEGLITKCQLEWRGDDEEDEESKRDSFSRSSVYKRESVSTSQQSEEF